MQPQLFVGATCPSPDRFEPPVDSCPLTRWKVRRYKRAMKPLGGLWTATYDPGLGSAFVQLCYKEGQIWRAHATPDHLLGADELKIYRAWLAAPWPWMWQCWLLTPAPTARIFTVDSLADCTALWEHYASTTLRPGRRWLDWAAISQDWDAIHLTAQGQTATAADTQAAHLWGWACECTLWLRWAFTRVEDAGRQEFSPVETSNPLTDHLLGPARLWQLFVEGLAHRAQHP